MPPSPREAAHAPLRPPSGPAGDGAPPGFRRAEFLPFSRPSIGDEEVAAVVETLRSGWLSAGPRTEEFEGDFRGYTGAPAALALNSCTAGLHVALVALGIGPGDEVVTTPMTFAATANVVEHTGARPVLADVAPDTLNLSPERVAEVLTPRTRAILPVHYAGHPADLDPLHELARGRGLAVVEDAAHALAASYRGRRVGSGENPAAFSFYATKNLTTGEGGMLTGSAELVARARVIGFHGMSRGAWSRHRAAAGWRYEVELPGFKYNMSDLQASLGLCQLRRLEALQARRRAIVALYQRAFAAEEALEPPVERAEVEHAWHLYVLRIRPGVLRIDRDRVIEELARRNVGTSVHFIPVHLQPYFRDRYGYRPHDFPVAVDGYARMLSLPLYPDLSDADADDVVSAVLDVVRTFRR